MATDPMLIPGSRRGLMTGLTMWLNGEFVPIEQARVSLFDRGFTTGDAMFESIRTGNGKPFRVADHVQRLCRSLRYVSIDPGLSTDELVGLGHEVCDRNAHLLGPNDDYWLQYFVSRQGWPGHEPSRAATIAVCCHPLDFERWNRHFVTGRALYTPWVRQMPAQVMEPKTKCVSRMHIVLAQLAVRQTRPDAGALLLDVRGNLTELDDGNFMLARGGALFTPFVDEILPGVTRQATIELAADLNIEVREANLQVHDAINADEAFAVSTPYCVLPVTSINGIPIGCGRPGPIWRRLISGWNALLGIDVVEQALSHIPHGGLSTLSERQL
jgi:branched-chain amino acid aminotransferase